MYSQSYKLLTTELITKLETLLDNHRSNFYSELQTGKTDFLGQRVVRRNNQYYIDTLQICKYSYSNKIYHFYVNKYIHIEFDEKTQEWKLCMTGLH